MSNTKLRRPLDEVLPIAEELVRLLCPWCERIEIAGSIRRRRPEVGDIEILAIQRFEEYRNISKPDLFGEPMPLSRIVSALWRHLDNEGDRLERLKWGERYRQFLWHVDGMDPIKVDLFTCEATYWGWAYLVRTGSAEFSHHVAAALNGRGYTSKDFKIHPGKPRGEVTGPAIPTPEEADVFRLAHLDYIAPEGRSWAPRKN